jgi:LPPG:FO 2-phospho-L-lactate transferase
VALREQYRVTVFVGGVGGARLAYGLAQVLPPERLTIVVNVGDDFWHLGLKICPDSDTVMYTLSGRVDRAQGWGVEGESTHMLEALRTLDPDGGQTWFKLGDKDLATHLWRTHALSEGARLTEITDVLCQRLGMAHRLLPVTDDSVPTRVETVERGWLSFQEYFVRYRWQPTVRCLLYDGAERARVSPEVAAAIDESDALVFAPSNPWLSVAPMLAVGDLRARLMARAVPRVAMTPILGGAAVKGPAAKLMGELGYPVGAEAVAGFYGELLTGFVDDTRNPPFAAGGLDVLRADTLMSDDAARVRVARELLAWLENGGGA